MTFDYVCARRNEIDPKGPCHIYIYVEVALLEHGAWARDGGMEMSAEKRWMFSLKKLVKIGDESD